MTTKPLRVSWSALRTHEECKKKSHLIREGKRAKVINGRNFFAGTCVDSIMREWLANPLSGPMTDLVGTMFDTQETREREGGNVIRWRSASDRDDIRNFCATLCQRLEPILTEHVLPYEYENGKWFKVPTNVTGPDGTFREIVLTGEMDLIVNNRGPVIWDLKGTADDTYWRKVVGQLPFYDLAVWISSGTKTRHVGLIQPMCAEQLLAWEVTDDQRRDLLARITRYANDVWTSQTDCTDDTSKCHWCDVKHACPRYQNPGAVFGTLAAGLGTAAGEAP